jgi:hypothetical protein
MYALLTPIHSHALQAAADGSASGTPDNLEEKVREAPTTSALFQLMADVLLHPTVQVCRSSGR